MFNFMCISAAFMYVKGLVPAKAPGEYQISWNGSYEWLGDTLWVLGTESVPPSGVTSAFNA